ncbi:MAG: VOC family protein [Alteraurantiacibacter sp.]
MTQARLEHVNLTVSDNERSARLLADLTGWVIRWRGLTSEGSETIHLGSAEAYLALYQDGRDHTGQSKGRPLNHVGLLVADLEAAKRSVEAHGLEPFGFGDYEPGQRFYFFDWDGIEFEVVSYA